MSCLTKKVGHKKASTKSDLNNQKSDEIYSNLQSLCGQEENCNIERMGKDVNAVEVCGARQGAQSRVEEFETIQSETPILQTQLVCAALGPEAIERLSESLALIHGIFSEFRRELSRKMWLYDMFLAEVTQLMSQILTESEFNDFESAVNNSEFQQASKDELREGVLRLLQNTICPR